MRSLLLINVVFVSVRRGLIAGTYLLLLSVLYLLPLGFYSPCVKEKGALGPPPALIGHRGAPMVRRNEHSHSFSLENLPLLQVSKEISEVVTFVALSGYFLILVWTFLHTLIRVAAVTPLCPMYWPQVTSFAARSRKHTHVIWEGRGSRKWRSGNRRHHKVSFLPSDQTAEIN